MPISNAIFTLSNTAPTLIVESHHMPQRVHLHNPSKAALHYIHFGNAEMTLTNSIHIDPGETVNYKIPAGDELYAMSDPDALEIGVLRITKG